MSIKAPHSMRGPPPPPRELVLWFIGWLSVPMHLYCSVRLNVPLCSSMGMEGGGFQATHLKGNHDSHPRWLLIAQASLIDWWDEPSCEASEAFWELLLDFVWIHSDLCCCLVEDLCTSQMERKPYRSGSSLSWMVGEGCYICPVSGTFMLPGRGREETHDSPATPRQFLAL